MKITNIEVKNFKSFKEENIEIGDFTILIGANASGKSNAISLIRFLSNIINYGIDDAISLMGGIEYIKNATSNYDENVYFKYVLDFREDFFQLSRKGPEKACLNLNQIIIEFEIKTPKRGGGYTIDKNNLTIDYSAMENSKANNPYATYQLNFTKSKQGCSVKKDLVLTDDNFKKMAEDDMKFLNMLKEIYSSKICNGKKEIYASKIDFLVPGFFDIDNYIKIYDFDAKKIKSSATILTAKNLVEDGSNVANVLKTIIKSKDKKRKFLNLLKDLLPFIEQVQVEVNYDKSISYLIREKYSNKNYYSNFLSDGTVNVIAIIIALYFGEDNEFVVLEEPERNLHPQILSKLVSMAKDVSKSKQILITTHNPELIKNAEIDNVMFTKRTIDGVTKLERISKNETVKEFLKDELGLDDLFVNGFLGI